MEVELHDIQILAEVLCLADSYNTIVMSHVPIVNNWKQPTIPVSRQMDSQDNDKGMRHDFSRSRDTKAILPEHDRMQLDLQDISSDNVENDIVLLCPSDTLRNILRHVLLYVRDMCLVIWRRIIEFWHVEYELQRTIVNVIS
jgi:hypothetical protein